MSSCIYCTAEANSKEHWIPRGLGAFRGYTPLLERLCEECNRRLGHELDQELMRTGLTGMFRAMLGVEGRRGKPQVTAFHYKAMQADQPTKMMMPALGREHEILAEAYSDEQGRPSARPIRQIVVRMPDGRMECVPFARGWNTDQLKKAVDSRGVGEGALAEIYLEDDEDPTNSESPAMLEMRRLLTDVFGKFSAEVFGGSGERTQNKLLTQMGVNTLYMRAVAKVAFHYFLWASPVLRGSEDAFAPLRALISKGDGDWRSFVQLDAPQFLPTLRAGYAPVRTSHFFFAALTREEATAFVQFFAGPQGVPPPSRVKLAVNPLVVEAKYFAGRLHQLISIVQKRHGSRIVAIRSGDNTTDYDVREIPLLEVPRPSRVIQEDRKKKSGIGQAHFLADARAKCDAIPRADTSPLLIMVKRGLEVLRGVAATAGESHYDMTLYVHTDLDENVDPLLSCRCWLHKEVVFSSNRAFPDGR